MSRRRDAAANRRIAALLAVLLLVAVGVWLGLDLEGGRLAPAPPSAPQPAPDATWFSAYFTEPRLPGDQSPKRGGVDERFVAFLDSANRSLDLAVYELDLPNVAEAIVRAKQRGVQVRLVTDSDTLENTKDRATAGAIATVTAAGVPIVGDERQAIMHHKFAVLDGERVWTGSWNWTEGDTYRLNNNAVEIRSARLAASYAAEFEKLLARSKSGTAKPPGVPFPRVAVDGATVEVFFSPQDRPAARVAERVRTAQRSVHFLAFSFTHDAIGQAMLDRAKAGVEVSGVFETTGSETRFSEYGRFKEAGLAVYQDGNPYIMHHKVIVLDARVTIFGSFNFSDSADRDNDENLLIVDDPNLAATFEAEVQRVLAVAKNAPR